MSTTEPTPDATRRTSRPIAVLVAVFVGLGALGAGAGSALGAVGAATSTPHVGGHHHGDRDPGPRGWR